MPLNKETKPKRIYIYISIYIFKQDDGASCPLTYHLSENSAIKQRLIIKYNSTSQLQPSDVNKILTDNTIIIYKNNNEKRFQILEAICIKNKIKTTNINNIAFNTGTNILNILNN